ARFCTSCSCSSASPSGSATPCSSPGCSCSDWRSVSARTSCSRQPKPSVSAPSSNTCRLLARDHAAPGPTLLLTKVYRPWLVGVRLLAWCSRPRIPAALLEGAQDPSRISSGEPMAEAPQIPHQDRLEEIDNPIERLKLLGENEDEIAKYLDALEVTSPREREMLYEISRTRPLAQPELFPQAHRNMVEALESLARHGYHGTQ